MKRKVLYVITKSNWGGAQRYVFNLATTIPKEEFDVSVALGGIGTADSEEGELSKRLGNANIPTFYIPAFTRDVALLNDIRAVVELYRLFKKEKPDVVHLNSSKAGGVGALAARMAGVKKIIFTSHGLAWDEDRNFLSKFLIHLFSRLTFLFCHKVILISRDNFERIKEKNKFVLIYNGLPQLQFDTRERARVSLALTVGLTEDAGGPWIGTISELTRNKGLSHLIEAASILKHSQISEKERDFQFFIIGGGEEEENLKKQIQDNGLENNVHLVGFVSDAYRYIPAFDIFTLTSVKEGLPTVLIETGQAGVPVIATNIPGVLDIVEDGTTGLLVEPKNPKDNAEKLEKLIKNPELRKTLSENLNKKVTQEFSIERMVAETKRLY